MSSGLFESISRPLELVWDAFIEDDPQATIMLEELTDVMDGMVLQTVADGRITVYIQEQKVAFPICDIVESYLSYFSHFDCSITIAIDDNPPQAYSIALEEFPIPENPRSVVIEFLGFLNATATFKLIENASQINRNVKYPILCLGFPSPDIDEHAIQEFEQFTLSREFPVQQYTKLVQKRTQLESRNKSFRVKLSKPRKDLQKRAKDSIAEIQKREKQLQLIKEHAQDEVNEPLPSAPEVNPKLEEIISRIEGEINDIKVRINDAYAMLEEKKTERHYTRTEELELLEQLRTEVAGDRKQVDDFEAQIHKK